MNRDSAHPDSAHPDSAHPARVRWRGALRRLLPALLVTTVLLSASGGWLAFRGWQVHGQLRTAARLAADLGRQLADGDVDSARRTLTALQERTAAARATTGDPVWQAAGHLPRGRNLAAVREIAVAVDELARQVFPALVALDPASLAPTDGRLRLADLRAAAPTLAAADATVARLVARLATVPTAGLLGQVRDAVRQVRAELAQLAELTGAARRAAALLPPLLGADGPRSYLLAFQNLAELRATGGMFGAFAVIRTTDGRVEIIDQGTSGSLRSFTQPVLPLSQQLRGLYGDLPGIFPADVNLTPHFPTAARLYREMYRRQTGHTVDGILATDPVALSYLLRVIGPVPVPGFPSLSASTAVRTLLSDSYQRLGFEEQDRFFAESAAAVFRALLARPIDPRAFVAALWDAIAERRLLFWSARADEQAEVVDTPVAGVLPEREETPTVGVVLNDGSGAKLGYYLANRAELTVGTCRPDGRRDLSLRVTLASSAPTTGLTESVLGLGLADNPYAARTLVYVFSPAGGAVRQARVDGAAAPLGSGVERGRRVGIVAVDVPPGGSRVIEVDLLTPVTTTGAAELWLTPGVTPWTTQISSAPRCSQ